MINVRLFIIYPEQIVANKNKIIIKILNDCHHQKKIRINFVLYVFDIYLIVFMPLPPELKKTFCQIAFNACVTDTHTVGLAVYFIPTHAIYKIL